MSSDYCVSGTPKLRDDCQLCLEETKQSLTYAIESLVKAHTAADPVSELIARQALDKMQQAYGLIVQLHGARNAREAAR